MRTTLLIFTGSMTARATLMVSGCLLLMGFTMEIAGQEKITVDQPEISIVSQRASDLPETSVRMMGANGSAMGSYTVVHKEDHTQKYLISLENGSSFEIAAKDQVLMAENANRIVTFGDDVFRHVRYNADVMIYDGSGQLVKSDENVANLPYTAALSENGELYLAGKRGETPSEAHNVFIKYDKNGNKAWEKRLSMAIPSRVFVSNDDQQVALARFDENTYQHTISYYSASGTLIHEDNTHRSFSGLEYLSNGNLVVTCGREWFLYDLNSNYTLISKGLLSGNPVGHYPVTDIAGQNAYLAVSVAYPQTNTGFNIALFNADTGAKITETVILGQPYYSPYRIASVLSNGNINLNLGIEEIEISIEY